MKHRFVFYMVLLLLSGVVRAAEPESKDAKPGDHCSAVIFQAINFLPSDLKPQFLGCRAEIISAAKPDAAKPDERFGFSSKEDQTARKAFAEVVEGVRKAVAAGKSVADMKTELGRIALYVVAVCQPYRGDKAAFESTARAEFEQKLDALCSTHKAEHDKFQRMSDPIRFAQETSTKALAEAKKLASDPKKADELPPVIFSLSANSLADIWQSLLTKPGTDGTSEYIGNKSSKKFHRSTCRHLPAEKNQVRFATREEAVEQGYDPCKVCKP